MTTDIEDLIREAQARQAERAVDPDRIRAALPARPARPVRYRRYGGIAVVAAAGVAAAVTVAPPLLRPSGGSGAAEQPTHLAPTTVASTVSTPPAAGTLTDALAHLRRTIDAGRANGEIRPDVAPDLLNAIDRLEQAAAAGRGADLRTMADDLRHTVDVRVHEGAIRSGVPSSLYSDLDRVQAATRSETPKPGR